jgi:ABC-type uncharacterized transport system permease subunit
MPMILDIATKPASIVFFAKSLAARFGCSVLNIGAPCQF